MTEPTTRYTLAGRAQRLTSSEIRAVRQLFKTMEDRGQELISFAGGDPEETLFPRAELAEGYRRRLASADLAGPALQYSSSAGEPLLRDWIAARMTADGVPCVRENILVTGGSQQGLDLVARLFVDPQSTVAVELPTYLGALHAFSNFEAAFAPLDHWLDGAAPAPRFAYVMPDFSNPSGVSHTFERRSAILARARSDGVAVIEDQAYEALRYGGERLASIAALAARDGGIDASPVLYLGTFSKTVAPGLRVGWIAASVELVEKLTLAKQSADLQVSTINQLVLADYVTAHLDRHIEEVVSLYRGRRDAMLAALDRRMPQSVSWTRPEGGMFVWLTLPEAIDGAGLLQRALTERGIAFVPGRAFFPNPDDGRHNIRLSFSTSTPAAIEAGVAALSDLVREMQ